jgi:hypothetical protein
MNKFKRNIDKKDFFSDYKYNVNIFFEYYKTCKISKNLRQSFAIYITIVGINETLFDKLSSRGKILFLNKQIIKYFKRYHINDALIRMHNESMFKYIQLKDLNKDKNNDDLKFSINNIATESTFQLCKCLKEYYLNMNPRKEKLMRILNA